MNVPEAEMRQAFFDTVTSTPTSEKTAIPIPVPIPTKALSVVKALSPELRVIMHVTKEFEGELEIIVYDVSTLGTLTAEIEARLRRRKKSNTLMLCPSNQSIQAWNFAW